MDLHDRLDEEGGGEEKKANSTKDWYTLNDHASKMQPSLF